MTKRAYTHPTPQPVQPVEIPAGKYVTLSDYARAVGISRLAAYARLKRDEIIGIRIGKRAVLVQWSDLT